MQRHEHFMGLALQEAKHALAAGEFPVGCVIVGKDSSGTDGVVATGTRKNSVEHANEIDHAEIVALRNLASNNGNGKKSDKPYSVYCTMEPCLMCFAALILAGARHVVWAYEDVMGGGTACDLSNLPPLYSQSGVVVTPKVLRQQSLRLFKDFFSSPDCRYWNGSLLAEYTLKQ